MTLFGCGKPHLRNDREEKKTGLGGCKFSWVLYWRKEVAGGPGGGFQLLRTALRGRP